MVMVMMVGRIPLQRMLVERERCCWLGMGMVMVDDVNDEWNGEM